MEVKESVEVRKVRNLMLTTMSSGERGCLTLYYFISSGN